ncbi:hypothetical protein [Tessaracoccus sp.]
MSVDVASMPLMRFARALAGVATAWLVTWLGTAIALSVFTEDPRQASDFWYVGIPVLVLLVAPWVPRAAEITVLAVLVVLVVFLALVLLSDGSGYLFAAAVTLGLPVWPILGVVAGMAIAHGKRGFTVRWLTARRIDVWLHYRNES